MEAEKSQVQSQIDLCESELANLINNEKKLYNMCVHTYVHYAYNTYVHMYVCMYVCTICTYMHKVHRC